ncbi:MAG: hypothetical protein M1820_010447 [Bogoriella megaspora]|nr:MAG: hypothetical protein M1820_010447 [Bogoriella megaspora]
MPSFDPRSTTIDSFFPEFDPDNPSVVSQENSRQFYKSIGSPKVICAPMVNQSEFAWRYLCRSYVDSTLWNGKEFLDHSPTRETFLAYTPMIGAKKYAEDAKYRTKNFHPTQKENFTNSRTEPGDVYLDGNIDIDRPLFVQFCANDPEALLAAGQHVSMFCDAVDLNLGCPQGIAKKGRYGAFLQDEWSLIHNMIRHVRINLPNTPVTAKIRIHDTKEKTLKYAKMILNAGASVITVHARNREQKAQKTGLADWSYIRYLRDNLPPKTVIFANGNILEHGDINDCLEKTGADAAMVAEGCLTDPSIFAPPPPSGKETSEYFRDVITGNGGFRLDAVLRRYVDIIWKYVYGQEPPVVPDHALEKAKSLPVKLQRSDPNLIAMKAHFFELLRAFNAKHTYVRDKLHHIPIGDMVAFEEVIGHVQHETNKAIDHYSLLEESGQLEQAREFAYMPSISSDPKVRSCQRPWWVCQPYVRPTPEEAEAMGAINQKKTDRMEE